MGCGCSQPQQNEHDDKKDGSPAVAQPLAALDIKDDAQKPVDALNKVDVAAARRRTSALNLTKDGPRRRLAITTDFNEADDETEIFVHKVRQSARRVDRFSSRKVFFIFEKPGVGGSP
jgi:hypothetical protein